MLVFDASGSMAGNDMLGIATTVTRIDKVRSALAKVLPSATRHRRVGLITYGPGPYNQCNVKLNLKPRPMAATAIMQAVNSLTPAGKTPLSDAVTEAAEVLNYKSRPSLIVVLTDGEETCGGQPCDLGKQLNASAEALTIHVIGFRVKDFSWTGEQSLLDIKCLAEETGGLYAAAQSEEELIDALEKTLGCPMMSTRPRNQEGYAADPAQANISLSKGMLIKQRDALARKIGEMQRRSEEGGLDRAQAAPAWSRASP